MADAAPSAAAAPEEQMANLHLDEVTGERVSKSELKKRQKQRQKEEEKKKREAAAPPKPMAAKKNNAEADEKELNPNVSGKIVREVRWGRPDTDGGVPVIAIFRDPVPQHQQTEADQKTHSVPA
jgi:hypothetical protein